MGTYESGFAPQESACTAPTATVFEPTAESISQKADANVGGELVNHNAGPRLTDEQREAAIERAGVLIHRYMGIWERTGCFAARGDADRARRLMEQLIAGRSREYIAKLERERGLA